MASVADLKSEALELLGVKQIGQGSNHQDSAAMGKAYTQVYADLKSEGIAVWAETGTIPDDVAPHLISLMAFNRCDHYGISNARYQRLVSRATPAKSEIRRLTAPDYESLEEPDDF